jgi:hypothetical protein
VSTVSSAVGELKTCYSLTLDGIMDDHLDHLLTEALYAVSPTFEVTGYQTLWFGLGYDSERINHGEPDKTSYLHGPSARVATPTRSSVIRRPSGRMSNRTTLLGRRLRDLRHRSQEGSR